MRNSLVICCGAIVLLMMCASVARSQDTGAINGQVLDPTQAAVPNATVEAVNQDTGLSRRAVSNQEGAFFIQALPPGRYRVSAVIQGFKSFSRTGVVVSVGQNARADIQLEVGAVAENVTVQGTVVGVDTQGSTVGASIERHLIASLPLLDLNVLQLATMIPGMSQASLPTVVTNSRSGPTISVDGGRLRDNNMMLDGVTLVSSLYGTAQNLPAPDALEEFRVMTNTYSAEYGQAMGSIFLAVTKGGTNSPHGSAYEYLRNDAVNGRNAFSTSVPLLRQNQFGGSIGGPVILPHYNGRDRTFFFFAYQGLRLSSQSLSTSFPATSLERVGNFSATAKAVIDPTTATAFPGNIIPASRMDPFAVKVYTMYQPLLPTQANGQNTLLVSTRSVNNQETLKFDQHLSTTNNLSLRYFNNKDVTNNVTPLEYLPIASAGTRVPVQSLTLSDTHSFSPVMLLETRLAYTRVNSQSSQPSRQKQMNSYDLGGKFYQPAAVSPQVTVSSRAGISPGTLSREVDNEYQLELKLSRTTGRHTLKFGGSTWYGRQVTATSYRAMGIFTFDGTFSGTAMADYMLGRPGQLLISCMYYTAYHGRNSAGYAQDDFKVNRRLTLNLGVRYQLQLPYTMDRGYAANIIPGRQSTVIPSAPPGMVYVGDPGIPESIYPENKKNFEPRVGFAWDVFGTGKTSVRGGFGRVSVLPAAVMHQHQFENPPFQRVVSLSPPASFADPYGGGTDPLVGWVLNDAYLKNPTWAYPFQASRTETDFRSAYTMQMNLNVQRQIGSDVFIQAAYVGKVSHHLPVENESNAAVYGPGATSGNTQQRRPFLPQYYAGIAFNHSDGNANYHALQFQAQKRLSRNYMMNLSYTWSKSIDQGSNDNAEGGTASNPYDYLKGERAVSAFDRRNVLAINGVWNAPGFGGSSLVSRMFGGWQLSGTLQRSSGSPFSITTGADTALIGSSRAAGSQRANLVDNAFLDVNRSRPELIAKYFNTAAFRAPATGTFGNSGRNILTGPGTVNTNLALLKTFRLSRENLGKIQFRAEAYNWLNWVNLGNPASALNASNFGQINSAGSARVLQFGLRYDF
jgi:hypothetical protein